jgi:rare lipoprotein A
MRRSLTFCALSITLAFAAIPLAQPALATTAKELPAATSQTGKVSYYGRKFSGRKTASGEVFDANAMTMAHRTLPFGTLVRVTNLRNKRSALLRVNDRGPFVRSRVADVSLAAAKQLRMVHAGVIRARIEVIDSEAESRSPDPGAEKR